MNKARIFGFGALVLLAGLYLLKVGGLQQGSEQIDPRVKYCFDVASNESGDRIFLAAGQAGLHSFDLIDGQLNYRSTYHDGGYFRNVKYHAGRIYLADSERGLVVLDVHGNLPETVWVQGESSAMGLHIEEDKAYVAAFEKGLQIFDLTQPEEPQLIGAIESGGYAWDVWVQGSHAYIADFQSGLVVMDVSVPMGPRIVASLTWAERYPTAEIVRGEGNTVFIAASDHGLILVDIVDPAHPVLASTYRPLRMGNAEGLAVREGVVYLTMRSKLELKVGEKTLFEAPTVENGVHILDVRDPYSPRLLGKAAFLGMVEGGHVTGKHLIVANGFRGARLIDIQDPQLPVVADTFEQLP